MPENTVKDNILHVKEYFQAISGVEPILPGSPDFEKHSRPWSLSCQKHPSIVLVPHTIPSLQELVKHLYESDLDFAVRSTGCGNSSAPDVVLSMQAFDGFSFDREEEVAGIDAGLDWGQVDKKLAQMAPGYVVVGARCPYVGVVGSTLTGGLSWLSHEFGLSSDPHNLLDALIVLADGSLTWASNDPGLLWALRGGGGNFGVVVSLKFRARKYTSSIFSGTIVYPSWSIEGLSKADSRWATEVHDPKVAMHVFIVDSQDRALHMAGNGKIVDPQLVALIYDARGESHGRSDHGFKWALEVDGARELDPQGRVLRDMSLADIHELQRGSQASHGVSESWLEAALVKDIDEDFLVRAFQWYRSTVVRDAGKWAQGTFVLLEVMQEPALGSSPSPQATAWPHGMKGRQHVLQLAVGTAPGPATSNALEATPKSLHNEALEILTEAPNQISNVAAHPAGDFLPNFTLPNHDLRETFGGDQGNWERMRRVKAEYDGRARFNKGMFIPPAV